MRLTLLPGEFGIARLGPGEAVPEWATRGGFTSITRTADELSVVCAVQGIPARVLAARGWRCIRVLGRMDFSLTGVLESLARPLAAARVSIFAVSTYDTDYLLVQEHALGRAIECLRAAGHEITE